MFYDVNMNIERTDKKDINITLRILIKNHNLPFGTLDIFNDGAGGGSFQFEFIA